jgi:predicted transcriptional regulator
MSEKNNEDDRELTLEEWQIQAIKKGIEDADQGRLIDHQRVKEWVASWGTADEKDPPTYD